MILKARPMITDAWTFIDGIERAGVWRTGSSDPSIWDEDGFTVDQSFQATAMEKKDEVDVIVVDCAKRNGARVRYVLPFKGFAYLMNDDGKTIERL